MGTPQIHRSEKESAILIAQRVIKFFLRFRVITVVADTTPEGI
jgi:hypothetical protein